MTIYYFECQTMDCPNFLKETKTDKLTGGWKTAPPFKKYVKESICKCCGESMDMTKEKTNDTKFSTINVHRPQSRKSKNYYKR